MYENEGAQKERLPRLLAEARNDKGVIGPRNDKGKECARNGGK